MNKTLPTNSYHNLITPACILLVLAGVFVYIYFLMSSVTKVVIQKEQNQTVNELRSEIARLESDYIIAKHNINTQIANIDGLAINQNKIFINDKPRRDFVMQ